MKLQAIHAVSLLAALVLVTRPVSSQVLTSNCAGCDATFTSTYDATNCTIEYKTTNNNFSDDICFLLEGIPFGRKVLDDGESATNTVTGVASVTTATSSFCCGAEMSDALICSNCDDFLCSAAYHKPSGAKTSNSYHSTLDDTLAIVSLEFDSLLSGNTVTYRVTNLAAVAASVSWSGTGITNQSVPPGGFIQAVASGTAVSAGFAPIEVDGGSAKGVATTHFVSSGVPAMGRAGVAILIVLALAGIALVLRRPAVGA